MASNRISTNLYFSVFLSLTISHKMDANMKFHSFCKSTSCFAVAAKRDDLSEI